MLASLSTSDRRRAADLSIPNLRNRSGEGVNGDAETIRHGEAKSSASRQRRSFSTDPEAILGTDIVKPEDHGVSLLESCSRRGTATIMTR